MIEFIEKTQAGNPKNKLELIVDDVLISAKVRRFSRQNVIYRNIKVLKSESSKIISKYKFSDFKNLYYLTLPIKFTGNNRFERIYITKNYSTAKFEIKFRYSSNSDFWKSRKNYLRFYGNYSKYVADLNYPQSEIAKNLEQLNLRPRVGSLSHKSYAFEVLFVVMTFDDDLINEISKYLNILNHYHEEVLKIFEKDEQEPNHLITNIFNFPEKVKFSCEQYLLYFAQFLQDLGINTTSNLKEEAGKVLFSITPTDDIEGLDKIREALVVYLNLPSTPIEYNESFAAMRLHQQIDNLQHSQRMAEREIRSSERELRLAQIVIEHQDKVILQKDTIIGQQNKVIEKVTSKSIMMESLENKAEFEKVFDGLEIGESKELKEKLGIKLNPVTFLQSLGRTISGNDDEITSLNLNEETDKNN